MQIASSPAASIPAATASRRIAYSAREMVGGRADVPVPFRPFGPPPRLAGRETFFSVCGKLFHRLCDLLWVGHEELFLRTVERHRRDVGRSDAHDWPVEAVECVLGDDRRYLAAEPPGHVVLVHDHGLARLAHRLQDRLPVQARHRPAADDLPAPALPLEVLGCVAAGAW